MPQANVPNGADGFARDSLSSTQWSFTRCRAVHGTQPGGAPFLLLRGFEAASLLDRQNRFWGSLAEPLKVEFFDKLRARTASTAAACGYRSCPTSQGSSSVRGSCGPAREANGGAFAPRSTIASSDSASSSSWPRHAIIFPLDYLADIFRVWHRRAGGAGCQRDHRRGYFSKWSLAVCS